MQTSVVNETISAGKCLTSIGGKKEWVSAGGEVWSFPDDDFVLTVYYTSARRRRKVRESNWRSTVADGMIALHERSKRLAKKGY